MKVKFNIGTKTIIEKTGNVSDLQVKTMRKMIAHVYKCSENDIVTVFEAEQEISNFDVTSDGIFDWMDTEARIINGVKLNLIEGSDEHLEAISNGTLDDYLIFIP